MNAKYFKKCWFWFLILTFSIIFCATFLIIKFCYEPAEWVAIFIALLLGFAATFREWIISCFKKPNCQISIRNEFPDCHRAVHRNNQTGEFLFHSYYIRFKVKNKGNNHMEDVEAMLEEIEEMKPDGRYEKNRDILPMNLVWSYYRKVTMPKIQPELFKHCDLCHIVRSKDASLDLFGRSESTNLAILLDVAKETFMGGYILEPGEYKIKVKIAANNLKPKTILLHLKINEDIKIDRNEWTLEETKKMAQNITVKIL